MVRVAVKRGHRKTSRGRIHVTGSLFMSMSNIFDLLSAILIFFFPLDTRCQSLNSKKSYSLGFYY